MGCDLAGLRCDLVGTWAQLWTDRGSKKTQLGYSIGLNLEKTNLLEITVDTLKIQTMIQCKDIRGKDKWKELSYYVNFIRACSSSLGKNTWLQVLLSLVAGICVSNYYFCRAWISAGLCSS